jgi:hypothetical protein
MIEEMPTIANDEKLPDGAADIKLPEKNSQKAVRDYQEAIYEDLPPTITREIGSNAVDAHRMKPEDLPSVPSEYGSEFELPVDRNVEIDLQTGELLGESSQPVFTVTDWGPGMSPEFMEGPFTEYRTTGKGHTNRLIGGKGIGAKCPLGYKDTFLMDVCWEGVMRTYVLQRHQDGDKLFVLNKQEYESRPFGTRVRVPVDEEDIETFKKACVDELLFLSGEIDFKGQLASVTPPAKEIDRDRFAVITEKEIDYPFETSGYGYRSGRSMETPIVTVGGVPYELDLSKIGGLDARSANGLVLKMGPGEIDLTLSRDSLQYTEDTEENVARVVKEEVVPSLKSHLSQQAGDIDDLSPLESRLLKRVLRRNPENYDEIPAFVAEHQKAIKLVRKLDSINFAFASDAGSLGNLKRVEKTRFGKSNYNFNKVRDRNAIPKMLSGKIPTYWTLGDTRGHINRKLIDRHGEFYLWRLDEDSEYLGQAKKKFRRYDDVEVEDRYMSSSVDEEDNDRFAAYEWSVSKGKFAKNYETPASVQSHEGTIVYGHKADRERLKVLARLKYFLSRSGFGKTEVNQTGFNAVLRVAKSNASALEDAGHTYVGDFGQWDELKTKLARQYNAHELQMRTSWFKNFNGRKETKKLYRLWDQVRKADGVLSSKKPNRSSYAVKDHKSLSDVDKDSFPANVADETNLSQEYPDGIGPVARRLTRWEEKLYALKEEVDNLGGEGLRHNEQKEKSIIELIGRRAENMSEVPSVCE